MMDDVEILLVEDNISDAEMVIRALKLNNLAHHVLHVKDGAEALLFLFAQGKYSRLKEAKTPKLVLLDLKMPKVDGLEVLQQMKMNERTKKIPVVVFTSSNEDFDIKSCYNLGVNSYVVKPLDFSQFYESTARLGFYWKMINQAPRH